MVWFLWFFHISFIIILDFYYAPLSGKEIYKISVKTLLKCPNKKEANKQTELVIKLSSQPTELTSMGHSIFYSLTHEMSIVGTNVYKESDNNTVRYSNAIILYIFIDSKLFQILLTIVSFNNW